MPEIILLVINGALLLFALFLLWQGQRRQAQHNNQDALTQWQTGFEQQQQSQFDHLRKEQTQNLQEAFAASRRETAEADLRQRQELVTTLDKLAGQQGQTLKQFAERLDKLTENQQQQSGQLRESLDQRLAKQSEKQNENIQGFAERLQKLTENLQEQSGQLRENLDQRMAKLGERQQEQIQTFGERLQKLTEQSNQQATLLRETIQKSLDTMRQGNEEKLEKMRLTVDEKLQGTLEKRLGESFKLVSERLEKVQRGLGEMQELAKGVGDLKRVMTNVKTRGTWGEYQLGALLEQVLTPDQYAANVKVVPGKDANVEYAIKLPGTGETPVWLPIDAKFPQEDYERLQEAAEHADAAALETARQALVKRVRLFAKDIQDKYIAPPHTTAFAILFVPTEGLYAELARVPGFIDELQRTARVSLAGPSTLLAQLNAVQMGFRTLAIQERSNEVWQVLGAVKTEFQKFGDAMAGVKKKLQEASNKVESVERRTRVMNRTLKTVEATPAPGSGNLEDGGIDSPLTENGLLDFGDDGSDDE